ncbi:AAA family ATPase [Pseudenhygromyxa sp. WMMC2535]|uniref:ATPase domain-containing protein n=1 Tax=Pseudenhygromyxa sp. WMMC2535 TaxID=2712867 RepID=UPI00155180AC|nr:ATPase domain-containing protein [Pseudenhygromyxa sp. WMMC2535]NVB41355.1 AAA family ATPase [Pseudenhygromyxa sp. WMMC2535]
MANDNQNPQNPQMPGMPGMQGMQGMNPMMMQMMQMMGQMAGGMGMAPQFDPAAAPFQGEVSKDEDPGLEAELIRPATFDDLIRKQEALPTGTVLDYLCLSEDSKTSLGGLPKGCTMALVGPPGKGKTRTTLGTLARVAQSGTKVAFVVAEEGFHDKAGSGRDDLGSRMTKIGMKATGLGEDEFREQVLENMWVIESQYHRGQTWDDFIAKYRYLVEKAGIGFVVIDSLNMLDPSRSKTADHLSTLKTYNHEQGVTCLCVGQIKDTGAPVGGEAMVHTADAVFLIEEMGLTSKDQAAEWGGKYRERIDIIRAVKSVTTPTFPHPIRIEQDEIGELGVSDAQPADKAVLPLP